MKIHIVDGNNYFRRRAEVDTTGLLLRNLIREVETSPDVEIWVWDGKNGNARRRRLYPMYKNRRQAPGQDFWNQMGLFQAALLHTKAVQVQVPEYEGDDVIASLIHHYREKGFPIRVTTNDKDFLQFSVLPDVTIERDQMKAKLPDGTLVEVHCTDVRLYKTLVGDSSDAITGIPGFGVDAWVRCDKDKFYALLRSNKELGTMDVSRVCEDFGIKPKAARWMISNEGVLRSMWDIIGFYTITAAEIDRETLFGKSDSDRVDTILKEFFV